MTVNDHLTYTLPGDPEYDAALNATNGLGAVIFCFADLTRPNHRRASTPPAATVPLAETSPVYGHGLCLLTSWRRQIGTSLIALGEWLIPVPSTEATNPGG
jgi:hypothetical protein